MAPASGMERLEFREVGGAGRSIVPQRRDYCADRRYSIFLLIEGAVEIRATYNSDEDPFTRRLASGAFFDLAVANVFGIKIGLRARRFEAEAPPTAACSAGPSRW